MKKLLFLTVVFSGLVLLSSCLIGGSGTSPEQVDIPDDWVTIRGEYPYEPLKDIHPEKVREVKISLDVQSAEGLLQSTGDGFIYAAMKKVDKGDDRLRKPVVQKYDSAGNRVWEKEYSFITATGNINHLTALSDGGFLLTVQTNPYYTNERMFYEKSLILRCGRNGDILWQQELDDFSGDMVNTVFFDNEDNLYAVGTGRVKDGIQTKTEVASDIVITKLDPEGRLIAQKWFGGSDFEHVYSAAYSEASGIILWGSSQSHDGDFVTSESKGGQDFIAAFNQDLEVCWIFPATGGRRFDTQPCIADDGAIFVPGSLNEAGGKLNGILIRLDARGNMVWEKKGYDGYWGSVIQQLDNGDIVIGKGYDQTGMLAVIDKDGNEKLLERDLKFYPGRIYPVDDGGFIVTAMRIVGYAPQPMLISSILYDTELMVMKYRGDYTLEWRKTYDRYQGTHQRDSVWPQRDGSLVVPR